MKTTHLHLFLFILFLGCTSSLTAQYKWFNPQKESFPVVRGQAWQEDPAGFYTRLPQRAKIKYEKRYGTYHSKAQDSPLHFVPMLRK